MANKGATIWARKTVDSAIFKKSDVWFKIWFFLVNRVNYADNGQFKRGECFTTYGEIMRDTLATKGQIDKCIRFLKKERMLTTHKSTRGMHIKVLNYNRYQTLDNYKVDTAEDKRSKRGRQAVDTINKKEKNNKNKKNLPSAASDADKTLEKQIGEAIKQFKPINPSYKNLYKMMPQRDALRRMITEHGYEKTLATIQALPGIINKPYAPKPITPCQVEKDLGKLIAYWNQQEAINKPKGIII